MPRWKVRWSPEYIKIIRNQVKLCLFIALSPLFLIFMLVAGRSSESSVVQEEIDLFSCFATPEWWANDTDRYFPKLTSYYSAERLKTVYFLPGRLGIKTGGDYEKKIRNIEVATKMY